MVHFPQLALIGAATAGLLSFAPAAQAFTFTPSSMTDTEFNSLILGGQFSELFVAESRWGNNALNGDREIGINTPLVPNADGTALVGGSPFAGASADTIWQPGQAVSFELSFDAITGAIRYAVGDTVLTTSTLGQTPNGIFLRTRAQGGTGSTAESTTSSLFQNLALNDGSGFQALMDFGSISAGTTSDVDYLVISDLAGSFTLKGEQVFDWNGGDPRGSRLANQIKVGSGSYTQGPESDPQAVPEPATLLGLLAIVGVGLRFNRRDALG